MYYCIQCDQSTPSAIASCRNEECAMNGVNPTRSKNLRRTSIHFVKIKPQLEIVLKRNLKTLSEVHRNIHTGVVNALRPNTSDFDDYRNDIESRGDFSKRNLRIILTLNFDGVNLKNIMRCNAWPIYLRLEGLPFKEKNMLENNILAAIMFTSKNPTERLLREMFSRLTYELGALSDGFEISMNGEVWRCMPALMNGVIDFAAMKDLYNLPRWNSKNGCHLCTIPGERLSRRQCWFVRFPNRGDRRTPASVIHDSAQFQNGLGGRTQMMDVLPMNRCHPDSLHILSAGVTSDLIREMLFPNGQIPSLKVSRRSIVELSRAIQSARCHTYAARVILGIDDLPRMTASEKDEFVFVLFPLVGALNLCAEPAGAVCILVYWLLIRVMADGDFSNDVLKGLKNVARTLKFLWSEVSRKLFTLKLHVLLDHAILEDMDRCGTPLHWTSAGFEALHKRLTMKIPDYATNAEDSIVKNFVMRKELLGLFEDETAKLNHPAFSRLLSKIRGEEGRFPVELDLGDSWAVPENSKVDYSDLAGEHQTTLSIFRTRFKFCSRVTHKNKPYSSHIYWTRGMKTKQDCVALICGEAEEEVFGKVVVFAYERRSKDCYVLLEEYIVEDPFEGLASALQSQGAPIMERALNALYLVRTANSYFKKVTGQHLAIRRAKDIVSSAVLLSFSGTTYVSRT
ncbi:hypothetical protein ANCCAN_28270 [Ancylostoma caninum]|uniref:Uncharacterized protein n=1 Tax=Ancylostoma caninum TaxID=29170 RepID=A0A368F1Q1_ANCCA|nr:hypothetical protein ANCCAN_28270 [Ancylostoma caninum]